MKRLIMVVLVAIFAAIVLAPAAMAQTGCQQGNRHDNTYFDTEGTTCAEGHAGNDVAFFAGFEGDSDTFVGGKGNDRGNVDDGDTLDVVYGGRGSKDICSADAASEIKTGCEKKVVNGEVL